MNLQGPISLKPHIPPFWPYHTANVFNPTSKAPYSFSPNTKSKVSSETQGSLLTVTLDKLETSTLPSTMAQNIYYHSKKEERGNAGPRKQQSKLQILYLQSDVKWLRWFRPSGLAACDILLSIELVPPPICSSSWQMFNDSGISQIWGSPVQYRLHFYSFVQWPLRPSV